MKKKLNATNLIIFVAGLLVVNFSVGLFVSPRVAPLVVAQVNKVAGTKISIGKVHVWPLTLSLGMNDLKVFDPDKEDARIVAVKDFSARLSISGLLSKRLVFSSVALNGVEINMEGEPDGSFNVEKLARRKPDGAKPSSSPLKALKAKQDWFAKGYDFLKKHFSRDALAKKKEAALSAKKISKEVVELPKGRRVHFKTAEGRHLIAIKGVVIRGLSLKLRSKDGRRVDIEHAKAEIGDVGLDPELGLRLGRLYLAGGLMNKGVAAGRLEFRFAKERIDAHLKDVDLDAVRFLYEDSLPVDVVRGVFSLDSKTDFKEGALDSRNALSLSGHELKAKGLESVSGLLPAPAICRALNAINPVNLDFAITGSLEKPEFSGFMKSLADLVKPSLKDAGAAVKGEATKALGGFLKGLAK